MAQAKRASRIFSAVAGAAMGAAALLTPVSASAQDVKNVAQPQTQTGLVDTILCETDQKYYAKDGWTPKIADLSCASDAARDYAETHYGVGILIHVGQDIPNKHFATPEAFGQALVNVFKKKYGIDAEYFLSQNDARATGVTFHIDDLIHGADNGTEVKNVKEAIAAMTEVVEYLKIAKSDNVARLSTGSPATPQPGS